MSGRDPVGGVADEALRARVATFLYDEAELLDAGRLDEWLALLTDDVVYRMPVRVTHTRAAGDEFDPRAMHFDETRATLEMRVRRLATGMAWAEDPPSRTRHFVTNIRVSQAAEDELAVRSNLLLYRNRGDDAGHDLISAERRDRLRLAEGRLLLAERVILVDQSSLGTLNLAVFL